jgi:hypothetical protein
MFRKPVQNKDIVYIDGTKGDILVNNNGKWTPLNPGDEGTVLVSNGATALPTWGFIGVNSGGDPPEDGSYLMRILDVSNTSGSELTDYQMLMYVHRTTGTDSGYDTYLGTACESDFSDIRFYNVTTSAVCTYFIESVSGDTAKIWVKLGSIPTTGVRIGIVYGNNSVSTTSDGVNTFPFFDTFDGSALDETKWTWGGNGSKTVSDDIIAMNIAASRSNNSITAITDQTGYDHISVIKMRLTSADESCCRVQASLQGSSSTNGTGIALAYSTGSLVKATPYDESDTTGTNISTSLAYNTFYLVELRHDGTNLYYRMSPSDSWTSRASTGTGTHLKLFNIAASIDSSVFGWTQSAIDFAYQRKYVETEPTITTWGSERVSSSDIDTAVW